jgi:ATP/maltotriose-dependent transcriptional regulator MalT
MRNAREKVWSAVFVRKINWFSLHHLFSLLLSGRLAGDEERSERGDPQ